MSPLFGPFRRKRIPKRAGVAPWPKLFRNLRASRVTELADVFPEHVVCKWIGNSKVVARKHYLQLTDQHFANAIGETGEQAAQKAAQQPVVLPRNIAQTITAPNQQPSAMPRVAIECKSLQNKGMGDKEPELPQNPSGKPTISPEGGANSGAPVEIPPAVNPESPDLVQLMAMWSKLSPAARAAIIALAGATAIPLTAGKGNDSVPNDAT